MLAAHKRISEINDVEVVTKVKQNICRLEVNFIILKKLGRQNEQTLLRESAANYKSRLTSL